MRRLIGPIIVFLLVSLASVVVHFYEGKRDAARRLSTSGLQAAKGSIRIGLDGYAGYAPSTELQNIGIGCWTRATVSSCST